MEILTMVEDERMGTYDNMLASTMRRAGGESFTWSCRSVSGPAVAGRAPSARIHDLHGRGPLATNGQRRARQLQLMNL
jgi:hypothetical protein